MSATISSPTVDAQRLWQRLMAMAEIGRRGATGVDRAAFSPEDRAARRCLYDWARELGLEARQDKIGNLFLRYAGRDGTLAPVLTGSHLDSQPTGGRFDGVYGVLAGLEAVEALIRHGVRPERSIEVVAWSNEEGGRFAPAAMGSQIFAAVRTLASVLDIRDESGIALGTALGETLAALPEASLREHNPRPSAYIEAHIEQGPRLERRALPVGIVSGIQGCLWLEYEVRGEAAHAGTTPREFRRDAFEGAVRLIGDLREHCQRRSPDCRFTVGRVQVEPNTPNTIPGRVTFTLDFRDADAARFAEISQTLRAARSPELLELKVRELFCHPPELFPAKIKHLIAEGVGALPCPQYELVSGAFHDALFLTGLCPVGMIFVRCRGGVSHNALEFAEAADLGAGAQVLTHALRRLAEE